MAKSGVYVHRSTFDAAMELQRAAWSVEVAGLASEDDLRQWIAANPYFGTWEQWVPDFNMLPVQTRAVLAHIYGCHEDSVDPYSHCALCAVFRKRAAAAVEGREPT